MMFLCGLLLLLLLLLLWLFLLHARHVAAMTQFVAITMLKST